MNRPVVAALLCYASPVACECPPSRGRRSTAAPLQHAWHTGQNELFAAPPPIASPNPTDPISPIPSAAFTTQELLFVIVIIALLIALLVPAIRALHRDALKKQARTELNALAQAILNYQLAYGTFPDITETTGATDTADDLDIRALLPANNPRNILFITVPPSRLNDDNHYLDPWGSRYHIQYHADNDSDTITSFTLLSCGPDKTPSTADDLICHSY